ncbi:DHBP synthase RibB-like alpha/beta domain-containing protein [Melampsora americana]|nr:DHBP synthase RibB-like alpha/beta domain-containing protein [Melampsora americana]
MSDQQSPGDASLETNSTKVLHCDANSITFPTDNPGLPSISCLKTVSALQSASILIKNEELVAFPTETVYGLGACATSNLAVSKIYQTKGRPADNPLIVHISSVDMLKSFLPSDWVLPKSYEILIDQFWPGPLTILVPTVSSEQLVSKIPDKVTCGLKTVAVRIPSHPIARALISLSGVPIAAPSANLSGRPSPTEAEHVKNDLDQSIKLILNGGPCNVGVESTVIDGLNSDGRIRVLRLGGLSVEEITRCLGDAKASGKLTEAPKIEVPNSNGKSLGPGIQPTTPGMKYKHYSPNAEVILINLTRPQDPKKSEFTPTPIELIDDFKSKFQAQNGSCKAVSIGLMLIENGELLQAFKSYEVEIDCNEAELIYYDLGPINQPEISAQRLFSSMRSLDECCVDIIFVEQLPLTGLGSTVMERLYKAAGTDTVKPIRLENDYSA